MAKLRVPRTKGRLPGAFKRTAGRTELTAAERTGLPSVIAAPETFDEETARLEADPVFQAHVTALVKKHQELLDRLA